MARVVRSLLCYVLHKRMSTELVIFSIRSRDIAKIASIIFTSKHLRSIHKTDQMSVGNDSHPLQAVLKKQRVDWYEVWEKKKNQAISKSKRTETTWLKQTTGLIGKYRKKCHPIIARSTATWQSRGAQKRLSSTHRPCPSPFPLPLLQVTLGKRGGIKQSSKRRTTKSPLDCHASLAMTVGGLPRRFAPRNDVSFLTLCDHMKY